MFAPGNQADTTLLDTAIKSIQEGWLSVALRILQNADSAETAHLFALGVCLFRADEFAQAAEHFEKALIALKQSQLGVSLYPKTDTYRKLRKRELANCAYLTPFDSGFITNEQAKENILIALAEACFRAGNTDKAKTLVNSLVGEEFDEIKTLIFFEKELY
jgi:Tetratricopeptide repeat.